MEMNTVNMSGLHPPRKSISKVEVDSSSHHGNRCYNILMDSISLLLGVSEIAIVIYLSISHFNHSQGVIAIAMLAPILLNFVGVTYFLSDEDERQEFERVGTSRCAKDIFQVPVFGPVFTAMKVLMISSGISSEKHNYERFEASAIRMRQAESFFGAAPEALVQLTVLLVTTEKHLQLNNYLEILVVILAVATLSEANMYAMTSNYYRLFHGYKPTDWKLPHVYFWQKCILFFHAFFSIGSRIAAMACLKAAVKYFVLVPGGMIQKVNSHKPNGNNTTVVTGHATEGSEDANRLGYYLAVFFLCEIAFRMLFYYIARMIKFTYIGDGIPSGCYESISYGWRATILDLGYQSKNIAVQVWFYFENAICFIIWWCSFIKLGNSRQDIQEIRDNILSPLTTIFVLFTLISIFLLFACTGLKLHTLRSPFKNSTSPQQLPNPT